MKRFILHASILFGLLSNASAIEWREQMSGLALTSVATYPVIAYGIAEDNWWAIFLGSSLGPIPGYIYADKRHWNFPLLRTSVIAGMGFFAGMMYILGAAPGNALTGDEESDKRLEREFQEILRWGFYLGAAATLIDVAYVTWESRRRAPYRPKNVAIGFIPFKNELRITARL